MKAPQFDSERLTFLRDLDHAADIEVTDFEAKFIESALKFSSTAPAFSDRQRIVIDEMFHTYGYRL